MVMRVEGRPAADTQKAGAHVWTHHPAERGGTVGFVRGLGGSKPTMIRNMIYLVLFDVVVGDEVHHAAHTYNHFMSM